MKLRYLLLSLVLLSVFMHCTWKYFVPLCDTTSMYWYHANERKWNSSGKILVLGDSQIVSGILPETIAELEHVPVEEVIYLPKPSQQPEGIYSDTLYLIPKLPKLEKIYVNLSPLNTSKNSITDAHKQLYYSFSKLQSSDLIDPLLRKVYFPNLTDLLWKIIIQIFPYFGLSSNLNRMFYDQTVQTDLANRRLEFVRIQKSMEEKSGAWIWKSIDKDPSITKEETFQNLDTTILAGKRDGSIQLWNKVIQTWKEKQIDVVVFRIPFSPQMEKDLDQKQGNGVADSLLESMQSEANGSKVKVYNFKSIFLNQYEYFADLTHLNQKGRDVFAKVIKKELLNHSDPTAKGM
ncbi:hypothetical protein EHQ46_07130 [Leptospira yanagawae]|uniref:SGNH/GDSL hydrolase family protein n=1 Tax=Leptospira yanagawae TaxID=293069 RepID=A0ABY2M3H9_9LEPT|nr:hypothetical protein [Leptospira yanagawae]TGL22478.1 hypothetical protein EHQ46_07130 [Leptospira yanagawae]